MLRDARSVLRWMLPRSIIAAPYSPNTHGQRRARLLRWRGQGAFVIWNTTTDGQPQPDLPAAAPGRADHRAQPRDGAAVREDAPAAGDRRDGRRHHAGAQPLRVGVAGPARVA